MSAPKPAAPAPGPAPGLAGTARLVVGDADTATALRSGDVPVLATPRLLALAEEAAVAAVAPALGPAVTTVGTEIRIEHLAPTPVGATVVAEAVLVEAQARRLVFRVLVSDGGGLVASGTVARVMVDREPFLSRAAGRA